MNNVLSEINQWSARNLLNINVSKTKEMVLCTFNRANAIVEPLKLNDVEIQSVFSFKLLGVYIDCNLKWSTHIDSICSKANTRVYFIKHLKRSGVEFINASTPWLR